MSWWIALHPAGEREPVAVAPHTEGATIALGGSDDADLNVTYNYVRHFDFPSLHGLTGADSISILEAAVARLGTVRDPDYWAPTEGNAGHACATLLAWARQHPTAFWVVR